MDTADKDDKVQPSNDKTAGASAGSKTRTSGDQAPATSATPAYHGYSARKTRPKALTKTHAPPATTKADPASTRETAPEKPIAGPASPERRHYYILTSFVILVLIPACVAAFYLWVVAKDQYASTLAFSIRKGEVSSSLDLLGGQIAQLSGGGGAETDVLYEFIRSQGLVSKIDADLNLKDIYSAAWPQDMIFAYNPKGTIEDLIRHWKRKVQITYDTGSGLMTLRALAFDRLAAQDIAQKILEESTSMINALSEDARADATQFAQAEVDRAIERLKQARSDLTTFRLESQIVDPQADLQGQMGVLNSLQANLADSLVELDLLQGISSENDPRVRQAERRIEVIENRISAEREKFGIGGKGPGGEDFATIVADYERLSVDREFAEETYRAALVSYDAAQAEAKRKSFYLAAHIQPTLAERSDFPKRWTLQALTSFFLLMAWSIGVLVYYSIRDRR
ncbi:sugar transporter [Roseovarius gaetbuli]|uniref:sugar transporter n=1 Tax=Roseovarius gaetbuli TaxID=1356575 RepID=UPI00111C76FD|nr:sugar transporter [Roseovarius gaetbuli]